MPSTSKTDADSASIRVKVKDRKRMQEAREESVQRRSTHSGDIARERRGPYHQRATSLPLDAWPGQSRSCYCRSIYYRACVIRRRNWDHEHHLCQCELTNPRDRDSQSFRCAQAHHSSPIPDRRSLGVCLLAGADRACPSLLALRSGDVGLSFFPHLILTRTSGGSPCDFGNGCDLRLRPRLGK